MMTQTNLTFQSADQCDLENKVNVTKILSTLSSLPTMCLCKFLKYPSTGSEYNAQKQSYLELTQTESIPIPMSPLLLGGLNSSKAVVEVDQPMKALSIHIQKPSSMHIQMFFL